MPKRSRSGRPSRGKRASSSSIARAATRRACGSRLRTSWGTACCTAGMSRTWSARRIASRAICSARARRWGGFVRGKIPFRWSRQRCLRMCPRRRCSDFRAWKNWWFRRRFCPRRMICWRIGRSGCHSHPKDRGSIGCKSERNSSQRRENASKTRKGHDFAANNVRKTPKVSKKPQKPSQNPLTGGRKSSILTKLVARAASKAHERPVRTLKTIQNNNNANKTVIPNE